MIIRSVMQMKFPTVDMEIELPEPTEFDLNIPLKIEEEVINETVDNSVENSPQDKLYIKWSDSYKEAHKFIYSKESTLEDYKKAEQLLLSESNNVLAFYDLGKLYSMKNSELKDDEKSFEFYEKALQGFIQIEPKAKKIKPYLHYQIGMMYLHGLGTSIDNQKAIEYFEKSTDKNMWASYQLGRLYLFGADNLEKNKEKAVQYLNLSAEQSNEYVQNILDNQEKFENEILANTILSLFVNLSRCIEDDYYRKFQSGRKMIDSKLRRMIREKNLALGIKQEHGQTQEY
jgi:Sel1 repeat protein